MPDRVSLNQRVQFGVETTSGTGVPANKLLSCFNIVMGVKPEVKTYRGTGRRFPSVQEENTEYTDIAISGSLDYQGLSYLVSGPWGGATITTPTNGINARAWAWTPPVSGAITGKTFTVEQGDSVRAHKVNYGLTTGFSYKVTRHETSCAGTAIAQQLQDAITMTSSPTAVALSPVAGKHINLYVDTTSTGLGTTLYTRAFSIDYQYGNGFGPFWPLNRANLSFGGVADLPPACMVKLLLEADAQGMGNLVHLQAGDFLYPRVDALGPVIDNTQTVTLGTQSSGTFTLTYKGQTTTTIAYNAASGAVQTALQALSTIGAGNATVAGSAGGPYTVTFAAALATDTTAMTGSGAALTTPGNFAITQTQVYYAMQHDMAIKLTNITPFQDVEGIYAVEFEGTIMEDGAWSSGQAQKMTLTNQLTAL